MAKVEKAKKEAKEVINPPVEDEVKEAAETVNEEVKEPEKEEDVSLEETDASEVDAESEIDVEPEDEKGEAKKSAGSANTDLYKQHLQRIIYQELGIKVSKDKAWSLFKAVIHGSVEHVLHVEGKKLPLSGVGTFSVIETSPRGSKAGLDKEGKPIDGAKVWDVVPRFRFYPSTVINNRVEKEYGLGEHDDLEIKHYGLYAEAEAEVEKPEKKAAAKTDDKKESKKEEKKEEKKPEKKAAAKTDDFSDLDEI